MKYELRMHAGRRWLETRSRPGGSRKVDQDAAIDWAADVTSRLYRTSLMTQAVLWLLPGGSQPRSKRKAIWNLVDFIKAAGKICTCAPPLRTLVPGLHADDCPILEFTGHEIWSKR